MDTPTPAADDDDDEVLADAAISYGVERGMTPSSRPIAERKSSSSITTKPPMLVRLPARAPMSFVAGPSDDDDDDDDEDDEEEGPAPASVGRDEDMVAEGVEFVLAHAYEWKESGGDA